MKKDEYLINPCRASSIPLWKTLRLQLPDSTRIIHNDDYTPQMSAGYADSAYFRIIHTLQNLLAPALPAPFVFCTASLEEYAAHISSCYTDIKVTAEELSLYQLHPVYCPNLWVAVRDTSTERIVATGIGELDHDISEGILEWIQVSEQYRRIGLGTSVVLELLRRMKGHADFATVSGQRDSPSSPESLYRKCGFTGNDIWHILKKR